MTWLHRICGAVLGAAVLAAPAGAQDGAVEFEYGAPTMGSSSSTAYPGGDFAAQLSAARSDAQSGACDWGWGCGGSPFHTGPGRCDSWRVGPHWTGKAEGVFLFRGETDLAALAAAATAGGIGINPAAADTLSGNIDHGVGARITLLSYWPQCKNYQMIVSYLGVFNWDAGVYDPEVPYSGPLPNPPGVETQKNLSYRSALHSLELNAQPLNDGALQTFAGFRYMFLDENVSDLLDESSQPPLVPPNAANAVAGDPPLDVTDILRSMNVDNHLLGLQMGLRTDRLQIWGPLYLEGFVNAGAYCNFVQRKSTYSETRIYNALDDPSTTASEAVLNTSTVQSGYKADRMRGAFVAEAMLGGVYQINHCTRGRLGYQMLSMVGVELGDTAFVGTTPSGEDLLLHGWYAGLEYRR